MIFNKIFKILLIELTITVSSKEYLIIGKQEVQSYLSCQTDADCKENAFCHNTDKVSGRCRCNQGYDMKRHSTFYECIKGVPLGSPCTSDIECSTEDTESYCNPQSNLCECGSATHNFNGICYRKLGLGDLCMKDYNCYLVNGTHGLCVDSRCKCNNNMRPSKDKTRCLRSRTLGQDCLTDEECIDANSVCSETCECSQEYVLYTSGSNNTCIKVATQFGESCQFDDQCSKILTQSVCVNGICGCLSGYHESGSKCLKQLKSENTDCETDDNCFYEDVQVGVVECVEKKCKCLYGVRENGRCSLEKTDDNSSTKMTASMIFALILINFYM